MIIPERDEPVPFRDPRSEEDQGERRLNAEGALFRTFDHVAGLLQMAIIAGQRVLRKSMLSDSIPEWTPTAKGE
jgi:hypothetical protein